MPKEANFFMLNKDLFNACVSCQLLRLPPVHPWQRSDKSPSCSSSDSTFHKIQHRYLNSKEKYSLHISV